MQFTLSKYAQLLTNNNVKCFMIIVKSVGLVLEIEKPNAELLDFFLYHFISG